LGLTDKQAALLGVEKKRNAAIARIVP